MANYMAEVAKLLGVEIGEEFEIEFTAPSTVSATAVFKEDGFNIINTDVYITMPYWKYSVLHSLLTGKITIKRKPWKPKYEENYYSIDVDGGVENGVWLYDFLDYSLYKIGNCYRTPEDAMANRSKWEKFYDSDEVLEV